MPEQNNDALQEELVVVMSSSTNTFLLSAMMVGDLLVSSSSNIPLFQLPVSFHSCFCLCLSRFVVERITQRERESGADAIQFSRLIWPLCNPYCVQVGSLTPSDVGYIPVGQELNVVAVAPGEEAVAAGAAGGVQVASQSASQLASHPPSLTSLHSYPFNKYFPAGPSQSTNMMHFTIRFCSIYSLQ
jgi:hypothetical protein